MGSWDYGIMGSWDHGNMGLWDHGIMGLPNRYGGKAISNKYVLTFLQKVAIVSGDLITTGG